MTCPVWRDGVRQGRSEHSWAVTGIASESKGSVLINRRLGKKGKVGISGSQTGSRSIF